MVVKLLIIEGVYELWIYRNVVDFIAKYRWPATFFIKLRFFVCVTWLKYRIPSNIYSNYRITAHKNVQYRIPPFLYATHTPDHDQWPYVFKRKTWIIQRLIFYQFDWNTDKLRFLVLLPTINVAKQRMLSSKHCPKMLLSNQ